MKKLTYDELTARINASTSVSEINRLNKKRALIERETMKEIDTDIPECFKHI